MYRLLPLSFEAASPARPRAPFGIVLLLIAAMLAAGSCILSPFDVFTISGRLNRDFGCLLLHSDGRNYELHSL